MDEETRQAMNLILGLDSKAPLTVEMGVEIRKARQIIDTYYEKVHAEVDVILKSTSEMLAKRANV